jgi:hypothetical protein
MNRSFMLGVAYTFAISVALVLGVFMSASPAQAAPAGAAVPGSVHTAQTTGLEVRHSPVAPASNIQGSPTVGTLAKCGYWTGWFDAYYTHCADTWIWIRVNFWYGRDYRDIQVAPRSTTNLSDHPYLQGAGMITNAWCIHNC